MALAHNNPLLTHVHGRLGKFMVIKSYSYGTVISAYPNMSKVKPSKKQRAEKHRFANAVHYAKGVMADPKKKAAMKARLPKGKSIYHAAIAEFMRREVATSVNNGNATNRRLSMISVILLMLFSLTARAESFIVSGIAHSAAEVRSVGPLPVSQVARLLVGPLPACQVAGFPVGQLQVTGLQDSGFEHGIFCHEGTKEITKNHEEFFPDLSGKGNYFVKIQCAWCTGESIYLD
jgi:hypothetical protein